MNLKNININLLFLFFPAFSDLVIPGTIQHRLLCDNQIVPFFWYDLVALVGVFMTPPKRRKGNTLIVVLGILFLLYSFLHTMFNDGDFMLYRLYYAYDFIYCLIILSFVDITHEDCRFFAKLCFFLICYLTLQLVLTSLQLVKVSESAIVINGIVQGFTTAGTPNLSCHLILLYAIYAFSYFKQRRSLIMLISGIGIFCGLCRGAILGYILFLTLYIYTIVKNKGILKKIIALVSVVSCLLIINYHFDIWGTLQERENISESYSSGDYSAGRFERWAKVLNYMDLHDCYLFGTKIYNTPMIRSEQGTPKGLMHEFSPHNVYLAYLIETGIIGILLIACIYIIIMKRVLHYDRDLFIGLLIFMGVSFNTELCTNTLAYTFIFCFIYYSSFILTKSNYER